MLKLHFFKNGISLTEKVKESWNYTGLVEFSLCEELLLSWGK